MRVSPIDTERGAKNEETKEGALLLPPDLKTLIDAQQEITKRRAKETEDLVHDHHEFISLKYLSLPLLGVVMVVGAVYTGLSLMPGHDVMKDTSYWCCVRIL